MYRSFFATARTGSAILAASLFVAAPAMVSPASATGALAIAPGGTGYGSSWGYDSRSAAGNSAISACRGTCQVVLYFSGNCGAYASGGGTNATGTGGSESAAENAALRSCQSKGGSNCRVVVSACDK
jgi:hypothetical protein